MIPTEKMVSFHIERQFPAIYREDGQELVQLVKEYYKFLETSDNQSIYNARRMFEYRDIDTTMNSMLLFFKNKFLSDLPFDEESVRFIVKNIMSLYRRRGTTEGLKLFFKMFFQADAEIYLPARDIFKTSASVWRLGSFIQLFPSSGRFYSAELDTIFTYADLEGKLIRGSISKATAVVDKINLVVLNGIVTPILYLNTVKGKFRGFDEIYTRIDGVLVLFGRIYGSVDRIIIDETYDGTTGNEVGDIVTVLSTQGNSCKAIVSSVSTNFTGQITYNILDGGFGYTIENTSLLVSNQNIRFTGNTENSVFNILERVEDQFGNQAVVIGYDDNFVGFRLAANNEFSNTSNISTLDRETNITVSAADIFSITEKNDSSPGDLYPEVGGSTSVKVAELDNIENISLITDVIGNFANVSLDSSNYNDAPPALVTMSGTANVVTIDTPLDEAFDLSPFEVGTIVSFENINPGADYVNDVFAVAQDSVIAPFDRYSQILTLDEIGASMSVGDIVTQGAISGKIQRIVERSIYVLPYSYNGFSTGTSLVHKGNTYDVVSVSIDYDSSPLGFNASIDPETQFAVGRILSVEVINSGIGYRDGEIVSLINSSGEIAARGTLSARGMGITQGYWSGFDSHLNGYVLEAGELDYFNASKYIRDNDFYQEYSYEVISEINRVDYEDLLKDTVHLAGTKVFDKFRLQKYEIVERDMSHTINFLDPEVVDP